MANNFVVWGFSDNRNPADKRNGAPRPVICLHRANRSSPYRAENVNMTPRQARIAAALLLRAADAIESGADKFDKRFI